MTALRRDHKAVRNSAWAKYKGPFDRCCAAVLLLPALPVILLLMAIVRFNSKGSGLFRQVRTGKDGKPFTMYKIRTMRLDAEVHGAVWATIEDPRATRLGSWLRKTHLDELPQLFNVLKGEMALVGPRPERPEFVVVLADQIPDYARRLEVLPGVTGVAQINLPPDSSIDSVRSKLYLDRMYIDKMSFHCDARIILCTGAKLFGFDGLFAARLLGLKHCVPLHSAGVAELNVAEFNRKKTATVVSKRRVTNSEPSANPTEGIIFRN